MIAPLIVATCAFLAAVEFVGVWFTMPPDTLTARSLLVAITPAWAVLALAGCLYHRFALHFRITPATWRTRVPLHVLAALTLAIGVLSFDATLQHFDLGRPWPDGFRVLIGRYLANALVLTSSFIVIVHALLAYQRAVEQAAAERDLAAQLQAAQGETAAATFDATFVFDALHRIERLALDGDQRRVADSIGAFGEVLRAGLERDRERMAALQQELLAELG